MKRKATHFPMFFLIRGGSIPGLLDMCRYDNACPAMESESAKLESRLYGEANGPWIIMKRFVPAGGHIEPSADRWKSFGWECHRSLTHVVTVFSDVSEAEYMRNGLEKEKKPS